METTKCPVCGTSNSSKRQICHICGQLLSDTSNYETGTEANLQFINEELKAVTEAAIREAGKTVRPIADDTHATLQDDRPARAEKKSKEKTKREKMFMVVSGVVTVLALVFVIMSITPHRTSPKTPTGKVTIIGAPDAQTFPSGTVPTPNVTGATTPTQTPPANETPAATPNTPADESATAATTGLEQVAIDAIRPSVESAVSRAGSELGVSLSASNATYSGSVAQKGEETSVVTVSYQANTVSGSVGVLMRQYEGGWQATHARDLDVKLVNPVVFNGENGQETYSSARIASGSFEPLNTLSSLSFEWF